MKTSKRIAVAIAIAAMLPLTSIGISAGTPDFKEGACTIYTIGSDSVAAVKSWQIPLSSESRIFDTTTRDQIGKWDLSGDNLSIEVNGEKINATSPSDNLCYSGTIVNNATGESTKCKVFLSPSSGQLNITQEKIKENILAGGYTVDGYVWIWPVGTPLKEKKIAYPVKVTFETVEGYNGGSLKLSGSNELTEFLPNSEIPFYFDGNKNNLKIARPFGGTFDSFDNVLVRLSEAIDIPGTGKANLWLDIIY